MSKTTELQPCPKCQKLRAKMKSDKNRMMIVLSNTLDICTTIMNGARIGIRSDTIVFPSPTIDRLISLAGKTIDAVDKMKKPRRKK